MKPIHWTQEAFEALDQLTAPEASVLLEKLDLIAQFPCLYPERQRGRFAGLRYFMLQRRWIVYYRNGETHLLVFDLVPAKAQP